MSDNQKKFAYFKEKLTENNDSVVLQTLSEVRINGSIEIIPLLFDTFINTHSVDVQNEIIHILSDVKDQNAATLYIDALHNSKYNLVKQYILYSMWQTNLDFSAYYIDICKCLHDERFDVVVEAVTVIDTFSDILDNKNATDCFDLIKKATEKAYGDTKKLLEQMLKN